MPLSEHEQRLFEQIERSLAEDSKFASAVRSTDPRFHARRRIILSAVAILLGLALLILGVMGKGQGTLLGVAGFVVMFGATVFAIQAFRHGRHPELRVVDSTPPSRPTKRSSPHPGSSFTDRLEDRWRHRREGGPSE